VQDGFQQFQSQRIHQWGSEVGRLLRSCDRYLKCIQNFIRKIFGIGGFGRRRRSEDNIKAVRGGSKDCKLRINRWKPATFNIQQFCVLLTQCIYVFCVDLRTNSDYFPIQHWLTGFYSRVFNLCSPVVAVCTASLTFNNSTFYPHSIYFFVWVWEQITIIYLYSINWLVFITVLNPCGPVVTVCTASLTFNNSTFCPRSVFMCFVWIWEETAIISLYNINWLVFITETECLLRGTDWILLLWFVLNLVFTGFGGQSPACRHGGQGSMPGLSMWHWNRFPHPSSLFPCQYHFTIAPLSPWSACSHYRNEKRAAVRTFQKGFLFHKSGNVVRRVHSISLWVVLCQISGSVTKRNVF